MFVINVSCEKIKDTHILSKLFDNIYSVNDILVSFYHEIDSVDNFDKNDKNRIEINA
jgi:hypothetical protein